VSVAAATTFAVEVRPGRIELPTYGLGNRRGLSPSSSSITTCDDAENVLAFCLAFFDRESPDVAAVLRAWSTLPEPVREGILAMVKASKPRA